MSDTPISDSTPHNVADLGMLCRTLERLASVRLDYINQLEANNDAANSEIERLTNKVAQLYEGAEEQNKHIKRLEEAGDALYANCDPSRWDSAATAARKVSDQNAWRKAKEDKL